MRHYFLLSVALLALTFIDLGLTFSDLGMVNVRVPSSKTAAVLLFSMLIKNVKSSYKSLLRFLAKIIDIYWKIIYNKLEALRRERWRARTTIAY